MGWSSIPELLNKIADRFLPNRKTAIKDQIADLETERDKLLSKTHRSDREHKRLTVVLDKLSRAKKRISNAA